MFFFSSFISSPSHYIAIILEYPKGRNYVCSTKKNGFFLPLSFHVPLNTEALTTYFPLFSREKARDTHRQDQKSRISYLRIKTSFSFSSSSSSSCLRRLEIAKVEGDKIPKRSFTVRRTHSSFLRVCLFKINKYI